MLEILNKKREYYEEHISNLTNEVSALKLE